MSVSLDSADAVCFWEGFERKENSDDRSITTGKVNHVVIEKLTKGMAHLHASTQINITCGSVVVFDAKNWAFARSAEISPFPGAQGHTEGNDSMALGAAITAVGALLFLVPGGQGLGYTFMGAGLGFIGAGTLERSRAYEKDPNYVQPILPYKY